MDAAALAKLTAATEYSSSSDDDSDTEVAVKADDARSEDSDREKSMESLQDAIQEEMEENERMLKEKYGKNAKIKHVDTTDAKKKQMEKFSAAQGPDLEFNPAFAACFDICYELDKVEKYSNSGWDECTMVFCFCLFKFTRLRAEAKIKDRVLKLETRDKKLALHGVEFFTEDNSTADEFQLYRKDGKLTAQPPTWEYDEDGKGAIVENTNACWCETDEKVGGGRFIKKCSISNEISQQTRIYPFITETGETWLKVESTRYPTENVRIVVKATYKPTTRQVAADLV